MAIKPLMILSKGQLFLLIPALILKLFPKLNAVNVTIRLQYVNRLKNNTSILTRSINQENKNTSQLLIKQKIGIQVMYELR